MHQGIGAKEQANWSMVVLYKQISLTVCICNFSEKIRIDWYFVSSSFNKITKMYQYTECSI